MLVKTLEQSLADLDCAMDRFSGLDERLMLAQRAELESYRACAEARMAVRRGRKLSVAQRESLEAWDRARSEVTRASNRHMEASVRVWMARDELERSSLVPG